jgi:hypothetical protein
MPSRQTSAARSVGVRLWVELQKLADETALGIHVHHYQPISALIKKD